MVHTQIDAGAVNAQVADADPSRLLVAAAFTAGIGVRLDDVVEIAGISKRIGMLAYVGPTARVLGGNFSRDEREGLLSNRHRIFGGVEIGAGVRLANVILSAKLTWIHKDTGSAVPGLSRLQVVPSVQFSLPFDIVGKQASAATARAAEATNKAEPRPVENAAVPNAEAEPSVQEQQTQEPAPSFNPGTAPADADARGSDALVEP